MIARVLYNDAVIDRQAMDEARLPGRLSELDRDLRRSGAVMAAWSRFNGDHFQPGDPLLEVLTFDIDESEYDQTEAWLMMKVACGHAFTTLNIGHPPGWEHRSMCVGDVVILGESASYCASVGWVTADISQSDIKNWEPVT